MERNAGKLIPEELDEFTDPAFSTLHVKSLHRINDQASLAVVSGDAKRPLWWIDRSSEPVPAICQSLPEGSVSKAWAVTGGVVVLKDGGLWKLRSVEGEPGTFTANELLAVPKGAGEVDYAGDAVDPTCICFVNKNVPEDGAPKLFPPPAPETDLMVHMPRTGWFKRCRVGWQSDMLCLSSNGTRAMWRSTLSYVAEEAERGEYYSVSIAEGETTPLQATRGAARTNCCSLDPSGKWGLYHANYTTEYPITRHCGVYGVVFPEHDEDGTDACRTYELFAAGGDHYEKFGIGAKQKGGECPVFITRIKGLSLISNTCSVKYDHECKDNALKVTLMSSPLDRPVTSDGVLWNEVDGSLSAYGTEDRDILPSVCFPQNDHAAPGSGPSIIPLPQPEVLMDLIVEDDFEYTSGMQSITGVLYAKRGLPPCAPLLVHAHGGPAVAFPALWSNAMGYTRYPYRHLLKAGYRIFFPYFRGTLGFGDEFGRANVKRQGFLDDGDLGDIISGISFLKDSGRVDKSVPIGIFGGSYGGYLTLRSMSATQHFSAGVAMYGFVHNRWMSLETGDETWETEYLGTARKWPITSETTVSDVFPHLNKIQKPLLLLHGEVDDICPPSQSIVTFNELHKQGIPTGLVLYPGEGHGFEMPPNQRDRCRRTLGWFLAHMPTQSK